MTQTVTRRHRWRCAMCRLHGIAGTEPAAVAELQEHHRTRHPVETAVTS